MSDPGNPNLREELVRWIPNLRAFALSRDAKRAAFRRSACKTPW